MPKKAATPIKTSERFVTIVAYLPRGSELYDRLRAEAYRQGKSMSTLAGEYIRQGLEREKESR